MREWHTNDLNAIKARTIIKGDEGEGTTTLETLGSGPTANGDVLANEGKSLIL